MRCLGLSSSGDSSRPRIAGRPRGTVGGAECQSAAKLGNSAGASASSCSRPPCGSPAAGMRVAMRGGRRGGARGQPSHFAVLQRRG